MEEISDILWPLESRILSASSRLKKREPWISEERAKIIELTKFCLGVRDEWIPKIKVQISSEKSCGDIDVRNICFSSWEGCFGAAHLYLPSKNVKSPFPLVLLCCGHGKGGKQFRRYQLMAWKLAGMGAAVIVPDNIGQGERYPMGHGDVIAPFQCGISLQGLIVMETMGWIDWVFADPMFDSSRIAAIGNSGGGKLTLFLGALCGKKLSALSSSGYPSTFEFMARKEKKQCHCNIIPGIVGNLEMWQIYGCFAPKPMFLFQGVNDPLFPTDIFHSVSRKVAEFYSKAEALGNFRADVFPGEHSWDDERMKELGEFLGNTLKFEPKSLGNACFAGAPGECYDSWPADALTVDELSFRITGKQGKPVKELFEVYYPALRNISRNIDLKRVDLFQLAAQMEAFLSPDMRIGKKACE